MKHLLMFLLLGSSVCIVQAQTHQTFKGQHRSAPVAQMSTAAINDSNLISYTISLSRTTHILSPEPILYVDISTPDVDGDLPEKNICRLKPAVGKMQPGASFTVTLVTRSMVCVYQLFCGDPDHPDNREPQAYVIAMDPGKALLVNSPRVTEADFQRLAIRALAEKRQIHDIKSKEYGLKYWVNNIFICGDFIMIDIGLENQSKLALDVDEIRFKLTDKSRLNAHVSQDVELKPLYSFYDQDEVRVTSSWRNFYIFQKFTYPTEKKLTIELSEKQISGRKISLSLDYQAVLQARYLQ
jgi:conjugative transposon TraN protein